MTNSNTLRTRIQLKCDTENNWNIAGGRGFVPLLGEMIVYTADDQHNYSRVKIGDGITNILYLPFIDAGTINGELLPDSQVQFFANRTLFPAPGISGVLYIDLSTNTIYCYSDNSDYTKLSNFTYTTQKTNVSNITYWRPGALTTLKPENGILKIEKGILPSLNYETVSVVQNITKEE